MVFFADAPARVADGATALRLAGVVRRRQERVSNKNGERFAWVTLSDPTGEFEVFVAADLLQASRDLLDAGTAILVNCRVDAREDQIGFFSDRIDALDMQFSADGLRIRLDDAQALAGIQARMERADNRPDAKRRAVVQLLVPLRDGGEVELKLAGRHCADAAVQAALKAVPGVASVETV